MEKIDFKKELNEEQYKAVTAPMGQHLVLAGAGSGKTRTLVYRVAWLLQQGVGPEKILLLTFTNKAANEMLTRVRDIFGLPAKGGQVSDLDKKQALPLWGGTFHSLANRILRKYGQYVDVPSDFTILDEEDKNSLLKNISKNILGSLNIKPLPSAALIGETISFSVNSQISLEESLEQKFPEWLPLYSYIEKIAAEYQQRKQTSHLLDFDDLLLYWYRLTLHPQALEMLRKKWEHILVDEYQDTNILQAKIVMNLAATDKDLTVVGDDSQSIYSFRAADIRNILDFPKNFTKCQIYKLEQNYRSTPEIVQMANQLLVSENVEFKKVLQAVRQNFVRPELVAVKSNLAEADFIARQISQFLVSGVDPKEIVVLFRASHHSQALEMELNKRGIAYEMRGGLKFFAKAHVKDVVAWLKILSNHRDEVAWNRILQLYPGIGPKAAFTICQSILTAENIEAVLQKQIALGAQATQSWQKIKSLVEFLLKEKNDNLAKLLKVIIDHYHDYLLEAYPDYRQREDDLEQLVSFASGYENLDQFLAEVVLQESYDLDKEQTNAAQKKAGIILSTVHQAKGLEWSVVFIMNMSTQAWPHPLAVKEEEQAEERRLFYVAVTRAKDYLYLLYPMSLWNYSGQKNLQPSPFLYEIERKLLQYNPLANSSLGAMEDGLEYVMEEEEVYNISPKKKQDGSFLPDISDW